MSFFRTLFRVLVLVLSFFPVFLSQAASVTEYLPSGHSYDKSIPTPEEFLGFGLGERHIRYDQLVGYVKAVDSQSSRVQSTSMGRTNQFREQWLVTISSEKNLAKLDNILASRNDLSSKNSNEPLIIWLGYSLHGDELSGANAAMIVLYHLAASKNQSINNWLQDTIIVMEPSSNPDGMDRFSNWVNDHRGLVPNADPNHIEHHQGWQTGRGNHFGFDLNRDWLLLSQIETQNRMAYFQRYQPHVVGDFHELGSDKTYFFQPGVATRIHPLTPKNNISLTHLMANYHAKALDKENRLYFSQEQFDDFYFGKGSTYPDINGSVGILFEQASSKGMAIETENGVLTLEYGIKNHVLTSLSTIEGAWANKAKFIEHRKTFYKNVASEVKQENFKGYLVTEKHDKYRLNSFLTKLKQHHIKVYPLTDDFTLKSTSFESEHSYYIPLEQPKYKVIQALFDTPKTFVDNTFYDASGWTLPLAMNIEFHKIESTWGLKLAKDAWQGEAKKAKEYVNKDKLSSDNTYAYVFEWHHFLAPKLLNQLLTNNVKVKVATQGFSTLIEGENRNFNAGSIVIPATIQSENDWRKLLVELANNNNIKLSQISTGLTEEGVDIGSPSLQTINPIKVLLLGGKGVSETEEGEIQFYLENTLHIPVTVVEKDRLGKINLNAYTHVLMVNGTYQSLNSSVVMKLHNWMKEGGVVFAQKYAAKWLSDKDILKASFVSRNQINQMFDSSELSYENKEELEARQRISGAIFETQLDTSHPLTYGFKNNLLPVYKNNSLIMDQLHYLFTNVGVYSSSPLLSGYTDRNLINRISNTSSLIAHDVGEGRVIATTDNLVFRGYWDGSAKLLANSLFFSKQFSAYAGR